VFTGCNTFGIPKRKAMKTFFTSAFLAVFSFGVFSQDTIYTRNGEMIPAKVYEITQNEIKYKKPSNPDGPLYVANKSDVALIEYKNGSKDIFPTDANSSSVNTNSQTANNSGYGSRRRVSVYITPPVIFCGGYGYYRPYRHYWRRHGRCW
jgi:hypothetical protein